METVELKKRGFESELSISSSRSSGPGGQNVNKVNTRIELRFNIFDSQLLSEEEKARVIKKLENKISQNGDLILFSQEFRSQLKNKDACIEKFFDLLASALKKQKPRKATKPTASSIVKRLESKKKLSEKKKLRKTDEL